MSSSDAPSSSDGQTAVPSRIQLSNVHEAESHWQDFDSANDDIGELLEEDNDFVIPYDKTHRPVSTVDFDQILPHAKSPALVHSDDSPSSSPERGRARERFFSPSGLNTSSAVDSPYKSRKSTTVINSDPLPSAQPAMSRISSSPTDHFDQDYHHDEEYSDPTQQLNNREGFAEDSAFDLKAPPPANLLQNIEFLSERLFSTDHLKIILRDPNSSARFVAFLKRYRPDSSHVLQQYINVQKALTAIEYANALAESLAGPGSTAAVLMDDFELKTKDSVNELVNDALPGYVTHRLVQIVTEVLVKEITGQNTPIMRELVAGLAEVYCLTDPALPDNPIVYASEEFYRCTQYGQNYVIGRNCRFLQGPKSNGASVQRLVDALSDGQEICETILNYRRDGSPFMNLLMIAPLYDNKGAVRYFIGAQIDVNGLIEGGRGLDSFERLLGEDRNHDRYGGRTGRVTMSAAEKLRELASMLDDKDLNTLSTTSPAALAREKRTNSGATTPTRARPGTTRRYVGMGYPDDQGLWPSLSLGPSGRLPGVFQNYLLIRPYPSLRITFTSPALRIPGILQSKFLDRIGGPAKVRDQILDALSSGIGVTARVTWLPNAQPNTNDRDVTIQGGAYGEGSTDGKPRWVHCTPLFGSDEKVGVWMVVMVENESVTGSLNANEKREREVLAVHRTQQSQHSHTYDPNSARNLQIPDRPVQQQGTSHHHTGVPHKSASAATSSRSNKMYQEYLRREGIPNVEATDERPLHHRDRDAPTPLDARDGIQRARVTKSRTQSVTNSNRGDVPPFVLKSDSGYGRSPKTFPGELKPVGRGRNIDKLPGEPSFDDF